MYPVRKTLVAALFTLAAASAHADTFTAGNYYSGDQNNFSTGLITFSLNGNVESGAAGNIAGSSGVIGGSAISFSQVFCIDIPDNIYLGATYNTSYNLSGSVDGSPVNDAGEIAWLMLNVAPSVSDTAQNEGLQAAIWSVVYGNDFAFLPNSNNAAVDAAYAADLTALSSNTAPVNSVYWISPHNGDSSNAQAQVGLATSSLSTPNTVGPLAATPEPGSLLLLGTGLSAMGGLLSIRRRKQA